MAQSASDSVAPVDTLGSNMEMMDLELDAFDVSCCIISSTVSYVEVWAAQFTSCIGITYDKLFVNY